MPTIFSFQEKLQMDRCYRIWLMGVKNRPSTKGAKSSKKKMQRRFRPVLRFGKMLFNPQLRD